MDKRTLFQKLNVRDYYASELPSLKANGSKGTALCPFHDDTKPSLSVNLETGQFNCFACNKKGSIFDFYMLKHSVDFGKAKEAITGQTGSLSRPQKKVVKTYDYTDESGNLLFQVIRYNPKGFAQRRPDGKDGWIYNLKDTRRVLCNLSEVIKTQEVFVCEGEKDVEALKSIGLTGTCNPMGAGKWRDEYSEWLKDKDGVILPDNDPGGKQHALDVAKSLNGVAKSIKIVELPGIPEKGDLSDWITSQKAQGKDGEVIKEEFTRLIKEAPEWEEHKEQNPLSFLPRGSDLMNLDITVEWVVDRLIPKQSITLLHGKGGIGKTWLSLILGDAVSKGIPFMDLETQITDVVFVDFENSLPVLVERVKKIKASEVIFWHNSNEIRPPKLDREEWERYKSLPIGLVVFDTLRASQDRDENDSRQMQFIMSRLKELREMGFTILLLHHTPKGNDRIYKGSTAILDLADHVLSLHKVKRTNPDSEVEDEDDANCYYRLGTKDKTRYEPFHIFLEFSPERGFVVAPDPDEETLKKIHGLIANLRDSTGELPIQTEILNEAKDKLKLSNSKVRDLLTKGEGKCWTSTHIPERKNAKVYDPISVCYPYIYPTN
ncbi:AAA family ATPase [bacterium]|nr:AAA family ATPase [bacterium]